MRESETRNLDGETKKTLCAATVLEIPQEADEGLWFGGEPAAKLQGIPGHAGYGDGRHESGGPRYCNEWNPCAESRGNQPGAGIIDTRSAAIRDQSETFSVPEPVE